MDAVLFKTIRWLASVRLADAPPPQPADEYRMQYRANRAPTGAPR